MQFLIAAISFVIDCKGLNSKLAQTAHTDQLSTFEPNSYIGRHPLWNILYANEQKKDHDIFLGNCPPTPPLSQHEVSVNDGLGEG